MKSILKKIVASVFAVLAAVGFYANINVCRASGVPLNLPEDVKEIVLSLPLEAQMHFASINMARSCDVVTARRNILSFLVRYMPSYSSYENFHERMIRILLYFHKEYLRVFGKCSRVDVARESQGEADERTMRRIYRDIGSFKVCAPFDDNHFIFITENHFPDLPVLSICYSF